MRKRLGRDVSVIDPSSQKVADTDESGPGELTITPTQDGDQVSKSCEAVDASIRLQAEGTIDCEVNGSEGFIGRMQGSFPTVGC